MLGHRQRKDTARCIKDYTIYTTMKVIWKERHSEYTYPTQYTPTWMNTIVLVTLVSECYKAKEK